MSHFLLLEDEGEDELWWSIEHPDDCPTFVRYEHPTNPEWSVVLNDCVYQSETDDWGSDAFVTGVDRGLPTEPGRYAIEWQTNDEQDWRFESWIEVGERISE